MKILIVLRRKQGESWDIIKSLKQKLEKLGNHVDTLSREDDLGVNSLSESMSSLKENVKRQDDEENYDLIYTQDWSIAFPLLIPIRVFEGKHYCFFHDVEPEGKSKIFQKIVGKMMGNKLLVRTEELKKQFPRSILAQDGVNEKLFRL